MGNMTHIYKMLNHCMERIANSVIMCCGIYEWITHYKVSDLIVVATAVEQLNIRLYYNEHIDSLSLSFFHTNLHLMIVLDEQWS